MIRTDLVCEAIAKGQRLQLHYDGYTRIVEVHACGITKDGHTVARVWQVSGGSVSDEPIGWKLLRLDEVHGATLLDETSEAPRQSYRRHDKAIARIICQV
jgi:hypothetical protein